MVVAAVALLAVGGATSGGAAPADTDRADTIRADTDRPDTPTAGPPAQSADDLGESGTHLRADVSGLTRTGRAATVSRAGLDRAAVSRPSLGRATASGSLATRNSATPGTATGAGRVALDGADSARLRRVQRAAERRAADRARALASLAARAEQQAARLRAHRWVLPTTGYLITARFGSGGSLWSADHTGLDFATDYGTPVVAVTAGVVTDVGYDGAYGNKVVVTHDDGTRTWYCHLADFAVGSGQRVASGNRLGRVGMTGNTTGPHLHFETHRRREAVAPGAVLAAHGLRP